MKPRFRHTASFVTFLSGKMRLTTGTLAVNGAGSINASSGVTINGGTFRYNSSVALSAPVTFTSGTIGGTNLTGSLGGLSIGTARPFHLSTAPAPPKDFFYKSFSTVYL